ncbi:unnamed protein product [Mucor hiemalis]
METKLVYKEKFEKNSYSLVELGTPALVEAFESGSSIVIKGLPEDEAVLCTDSKTFVVRQVNTSNSIILIEKEVRDQRSYVHDNVSNTIELLPCIARLSRLDELLKDTSYSGPEKESSESKKLYTFTDLLSVVQASEKELLDGLSVRGAFEHEGYYRVLDRDFLFRLFDSLMTNSTTNQIDLSQMSLGEAKRCIVDEQRQLGQQENIPDNVLTAAINVMIKNDNHGGDESFILEFCQRKTCRFLGEWLLTNPEGKRWKLEDFMTYWKSMGHDIFEPELTYLKGLYVQYETVKFQVTEKYIYYFPVNQLSTEPPQRFAALFSEKPLWSLEEIEAFLDDLAPSKKEKETLLLKFARAHRTQNTTLYGSRIK